MGWPDIHPATLSLPFLGGGVGQNKMEEFIGWDKNKKSAYQLLWQKNRLNFEKKKKLKGPEKGYLVFLICYFSLNAWNVPLA